MKVLIEQSNGKPRLQGERARDLKAPPEPGSSSARSRRHRPHRPAHQSLFAQVRAEAASEGVGDAPVLARRALSLFRAAAKEHGSASLTVRAHLLAWALQTAVAQLLTLEAGRAGLGSELGLKLVERAGKCQGRASQAWVAAVSAAGLLDGRQGVESVEDLAALMREAAKPRQAT